MMIAVKADDKTIQRMPVASVIFAVLALAVAALVFFLTAQDPNATSSESSLVNELLAGFFGGVPFLYDSETELWLGIGIRHWAHTAEFFLFGVFVALAVWFSMRPRVFASGAVSLAICAVSSLFDQCHKLFVPGRHWDTFDLAMDALGYMLAVVVVLLVARMMSGRGDRRKGFRTASTRS